MVFNFWRSQPEHAPLSISGCTVERVENIKFLGVQSSWDLSWSKNISGFMKQAQQRLYFLRKLIQASPHQHPQDFLQWCGGERSNVLYLDMVLQLQYVRQKAPHRIVRGAGRVIGVSLPSVQELFLSRCRSRTLIIIRDASHSLHRKMVPESKRSN